MYCSIGTPVFSGQRFRATTALLWNAISAAGAGRVKTTWKYGT